MKDFFNDILRCPGKRKYSLLRFLLLACFLLGFAIAVCGIIGWFCSKDNSFEIIVVGVGMLALDKWAKALQSHAEKKEE